ncbi:hypothetical protein [Thalassospira sp. TSL5-1]|uniref:hypothetical protein n=1 Tax=Thalassospira sp. TSL5-1 TaxID=1544451 RepID=UPI00093E64FA|nr:hypothetical protein [Thalassospira sp. TSL5-1]OKH89066.1 hypothetical protein LF95_03140 [Thalassospira sp. TSL5-1]
MSFSLGRFNAIAANDSHPSAQRRAHRLAVLVADILARDQTTTGDFPQHGFYATAFALALWHNLNAAKYHTAITRAFDALQQQDDGAQYHREFIAFALSQTSALTARQRRNILKGKPWQNARVGNWLILRILCLEKGSFLARLTARLLWRIIDRHFRDGPAFLDRRGCFSAQYHAFCSALLGFSQQPACQQAAIAATELIDHITRHSGHANIVGRGAGQSFGMVSAIYALLKAGKDRTAQILLDRIEQSLLLHQTMPLNLLADQDGETAQTKPGWYSYNRYYDYLAFAGFFLLCAGKVPENRAVPTPYKPQNTTANCQIFQLYQSPAYCAQMTLAGKSPYDTTPMPVITSPDGTIILPPCGGEQDFISPYTTASLPLPGLPGTTIFAQPDTATYQNDTYVLPFVLGPWRGQREIRFTEREISWTDQIFPQDPATESHAPASARLFRLFIPRGLYRHRMAENHFYFPAVGLEITGTAPLHLTRSNHFSALGRVQVLFCQLLLCPETGCRADLTLTWRQDQP